MATQQTKRESVVTTEVNREAGALFIRFPRLGDDKTMRLDVAALSPEIVEIATYHGLKQKLIDAAAIGRNPDTGKSATDMDKWQAVDSVYQRLMSGEWNAPREGGDGSASLLARALMRMTGKTRADVDEWLKAKSDVERKALRANAKVAAIIAEIQAENVDDSIDTDELLSELDES